MKVTQEKLPASQVGLEIEITPEKSKQAYEQVIQKFTRSANIPGFRKGKVPRQVVIQRFGATQLKAAAVEELIEDSLQEAIKQEKIEALGNFQLRSSFEELVQKFEPGSTLTFSASVDVQPEVTLNQYKDLHVQAEEIQPDSERVGKVLEDYQEQVATLIPVEGRPAQQGDIAVVDFKGVLVSDDPEAEPEEFPGNQAQDFQVELAEGKFIEGFIDGIVGMSPGETKDVQAKFPESYPQENLADRAVVFTVTLKELKEKELPELDDDFAQEVSEFQTLAELRESLETRFKKEADDRTKGNKEQAILDELIKHLEVEIPETLIDRELNYLLNQTALQLQNQGIDIKRLFNQDTIPMMKERSRPDAVDRLKRTLALGEVAKLESITVESEEVNTKVNELLTQFEDQTIDRERLQSVVSEDLLREKIVDWLIEHSSVELVPEGTLAKPEADEIDAVTEQTETLDALQSSSPEGVIDISAEEIPENSLTEADVAEAGETVDVTDEAAAVTEAVEEPSGSDAPDSEASTEKSAKKSKKSAKSAPDSATK